MSGSGFNDEHTAGRSGWPKMAQRSSAVSCTQRTPAGLLMPFFIGMPGIGDEMDGAVQQAPQPGRQAWGAGEAVERAGIPTLFAADTTFGGSGVSPGRDGEGPTA